ncbi:hypothetical protein LguiB_030761 [Lonicera macranthoides]
MQIKQVEGEQNVDIMIDDLLKGENMSVQNGKNDAEIVDSEFEGGGAEEDDCKSISQYVIMEGVKFPVAPLGIAVPKSYDQIGLSPRATDCPMFNVLDREKLKQLFELILSMQHRQSNHSFGNNSQRPHQNSNDHYRSVEISLDLWYRYCKSVFEQHNQTYFNSYTESETHTNHVNMYYKSTLLWVPKSKQDLMLQFTSSLLFSNLSSSQDICTCIFAYMLVICHQFHMSTSALCYLKPFRRSDD